MITEHKLRRIISAIAPDDVAIVGNEVSLEIINNVLGNSRVIYQKGVGDQNIDLMPYIQNLHEICEAVLALYGIYAIFQKKSPDAPPSILVAQIIDSENFVDEEKIRILKELSTNVDNQ